MPLILGGTAVTTVAQKNSCRFNPTDDPTLTRSSIGTPTDVNKWTFSAWVKRGKIASDNFMMRMYADDSNYTTFGVADTPVEYDNKVSGSFDGRRMTDGKYLDPAAWYHYVMVYDSDNVTGDDRMIIYVNGERITALSSDSDPGSGSASGLGSGNTITVAKGGATGTAEWGGYMAEVALCDGQAYAASDFGEFDSDSPTIWKPKDISGLTFGNEGFYLDFGDSANLGADVSGNSNDFTEANLTTLDQTTDTPTNNFCTMNPVGYSSTGFTIEEGNTYISAVTDTASYTVYGTMVVLTGKWYWEAKAVTVDSASYRHSHGIGDVAYMVQEYAGEAGDKTNAWTYGNAGGYKTGGSGGQESSDYLAYVTGDILSFALDCDNAKLYLGKNGTWQKSGDPTSGATGTGAISITANVTYAPAFVMRYASNQVAANFGNPSYTNPSDDEADANDYGRFAYSVPSGYLALCTKNLGSDGG